MPKNIQFTQVLFSGLRRTRSLGPDRRPTQTRKTPLKLSVLLALMFLFAPSAAFAAPILFAGTTNNNNSNQLEAYDLANLQKIGEVGNFCPLWDVEALTGGSHVFLVESCQTGWPPQFWSRVHVVDTHSGAIQTIFGPLLGADVEIRPGTDEAWISDGSTFHVFDVRFGHVIRTLSAAGAFDFQFGPNGTWIYYEYNGVVRKLNTHSGLSSPIHRVNPNSIVSLDVAPDGSALFVLSDIMSPFDQRGRLDRVSLSSGNVSSSFFSSPAMAVHAGPSSVFVSWHSNVITAHEPTTLATVSQEFTPDLVRDFVDNGADMWMGGHFPSLIRRTTPTNVGGIPTGQMHFSIAVANDGGCLTTDDVDCDGISNDRDNCLNTYNPNQIDSDSDRFGDACDICPNDYDPSQADGDGDDVGDICDVCVQVYNPMQIDSDGDGRGDACEDDDRDGIENWEDNCPLTYNPNQSDVDGDSYGDVCDTCPHIYNPGRRQFDLSWGCVDIRLIMMARSGALAELLVKVDGPWPWKPEICPICYLESPARGEYKLYKAKVKSIISGWKGKKYGPDFLMYALNFEGDLPKNDLQAFVKEFFVGGKERK